MLEWCFVLKCCEEEKAFNEKSGDRAVFRLIQISLRRLLRYLVFGVSLTKIVDPGVTSRDEKSVQTWEFAEALVVHLQWEINTANSAFEKMVCDVVCDCDGCLVAWLWCGDVKTCDTSVQSEYNIYITTLKSFLSEITQF